MNGYEGDKGTHSEAAHEIHLICAQNYSRGGVGWDGVGHAGVELGGSCRGGVGHAGVGWVGHAGVG